MAPDPEQLLQAVLAAPEEDAPRLVYADTLMDRNASRGELIAMQIRLVRERMSVDERTRLMSAAHDLVREHTARFLTRFSELNAGCVFQRGFIEQLTAPAAALLGSDKFAELMAEEPVRELVLLETSDDAIEALAVLPLLQRLRALVCRGTMTSRGAAALAGSPHLRQLRVLDLAGTQLGAGGCHLLADSTMLSPVVVALNSTRAEDDGAVALASGSALRSCRRLLLARNRIGSRGGEALARSSVLGRLEHLALSGNDGLGSRTRDALRARWGTHVHL